jgi:alanine racemase
VSNLLETRAEIDLSKVAHNFRTLHQLTPRGGFFCPMVKANAYGHGDVAVARALIAAGAQSLGVVRVDEAVRLRDAGIHVPILLFGIFPEEQTAQVISSSITPVASTLSQLQGLARAMQTPFDIHLKFNTGMNRLGFDIMDAPKVREFLDHHPGLKLKGICTHLAKGEDAGSPDGFSQQQFLAFEKALQSFKGLQFQKHVLNSAGIASLRGSPNKNQSAVPTEICGARPGIGIYGAQPLSSDKAQLDLLPVMALKSKLVLLRWLQAGETVSYGGTWRAGRASLIGTIPIGYADGLFRLLSNRAEVLCHGQRIPLVGTICMDYVMVDLSELDKNQVSVGDEVVLIGEQGREKILATEVAERIGTVSYEVMTAVSERVPRVFR